MVRGYPRTAREGGLVIPTMLRVLMGWIADRLDGGDRLQRPVSLHRELPPLSFFTDAKAESDSAWIGGFLEVEGDMVFAKSG